MEEELNGAISLTPHQMTCLARNRLCVRWRQHANAIHSIVRALYVRRTSAVYSIYSPCVCVCVRALRITSKLWTIAFPLNQLNAESLFFAVHERKLHKDSYRNVFGKSVRWEYKSQKARFVAIGKYLSLQFFN